MYLRQRAVKLLCLLGWCSAISVSVAEPPTHYDHHVWVGEQRFDTEMADTPATMQQGMMFRPHVADSQAMLFIYARPTKMSFWMKNTLVPLDMLFFDQKGILQEIKHNVPPCRSQTCPIYPSKHTDNQYVLEIRGGQAKHRQIHVGDKLYGCGF